MTESISVDKRPTHHAVSFTPSIMRLAPLLANRDYHSQELALELRLTKQDTLRIREWCRLGLPHTYDDRHHILVNGQAFAVWIRQHTTSVKRRKLPAGHMWCPGCNQPQPFEASTANIDMSGHRPMRTAFCPQGHHMTQWVSVRSI